MRFLGDAMWAVTLTAAVWIGARALWREVRDEYADVWRYWMG